MSAALERPLPVQVPPERCIACGSALGSPARRGAVQLARCATCGTQTALPRPTQAELAALHDSSLYFTKKYFEARRGRATAAERRFQTVLALVARARPALRLERRRVLDIGCDTGEFACAAQRLAGVEPYGIDVASKPLESARTAGVTVFHGTLDQAPETFTGFALVTAVDVVEHVADPVSFLRETRRRLSADGLVYLETPNASSAVYAAGRLLSHARRANATAPLVRLFPPEHIQYFTPEGLGRAAARAGLRPLSTFTRSLGSDALAGGRALRAALTLLQAPDRLLGRRVLLCALLEPAGERA